MKLSERVNRIQPSPTMTLNTKANELKAQGKDVVNLSVGEPDFDTPEPIKKAAIAALKAGQTKYTAPDGTVSLKKAVQAKFSRENKLNYELNQIIVSCGAKHSLFNIFEAITNHGDKVIIPAPFWVSYPDIVKFCGGEPVHIDTTIDQQYKITADQLKKVITNKTRAIILNSPSNPSGMIYSHEELKALGDVLREHKNILIISDDIYEHIRWNGKPFENIVNVCPDLYDRTLVVNGPSKSYAMTGWRIGYAAGPAEIIKAMNKIQSQSTSGTCSIAQAATEAGLNGDQSFIQKMVKTFKERHDFVFNALCELDGIKIIPADGTFYAFPNIEILLHKLGISSDMEFSEYLLRDANVALTPGTAFGCPGTIRISYATSMERLQEAIKRIKIAIDQ